MWERRGEKRAQFLCSRWRVSAAGPARQPYGAPRPVRNGNRAHALGRKSVTLDAAVFVPCLTPPQVLMAAYQAGNQAALLSSSSATAAASTAFSRDGCDRVLPGSLPAFLRAPGARHDGRPFRAWLFAIVHNLPTRDLCARDRSSYPVRPGSAARRTQDAAGARATHARGTARAARRRCHRRIEGRTDDAPR